MEKNNIILDSLFKNKAALPNDLFFGTFGSYSNSELDIFFIDTRQNLFTIDFEHLNSNLSNIRSFLDISLDFEYFSFTSHLQKHICDSKDKFKLHVCYYPSLRLLNTWELLSFQAYLYDKAKFINGNNSVIEPFYKEYRRRGLLDESQSILKEQITFYSQIAVNYYFYLICNHLAFNLFEIFDKISYSIRFLLTEKLMETLPVDEPINFWDWKDLKDYSIRNNFQTDLINTIFLVREENIKIDQALLDYLFKEYFSLYNDMI